MRLGLGPGIFAALSIGTIAGLSRAMSDCAAYRVVDALIVALVGWFISSVITWLTGALVLKVKVLEGRLLSDWMYFWLAGWMGGGATAGLLIGLIANYRKKAKPVETLQRSEPELWNWFALRWRQWLIAGMVVASISTLIVVLLMAFGEIEPFISVCNSFGLGLIFALGWSVTLGLGGAAIVGASASVLGALFGMLRGALSGPDIERRIAPNQGIRNSAINVAAFALIGGITFGLLHGLLNLSLTVWMTGVMPEASDWLFYRKRYAKGRIDIVLIFGP
jgi:hypothetical protein